MVLSDNEIKASLKSGKLRIVPCPVRMNPAGIDLRIDRATKISPHQHALVATIERVELPKNLAGILHLRSSLAREGLFASLALVDPGFRGQLTVSLYNAGEKYVQLRRGERFIQLSLLRLGKPAQQEYRGRYQDSRGAVSSRRQKKNLTRVGWKGLYMQ